MRLKSAIQSLFKFLAISAGLLLLISSVLLMTVLATFLIIKDRLFGRPQPGCCVATNAKVSRR